MAEESFPRVSWLSPKTKVRESPIHGRGLFAVGDFVKEEIVAVKGGRIITREQLHDVNQRLGPVEIQIADDLFIAPVTAEEREASMLYSNHSCDANLGIRGNIIFVAMRDSAAKRGFLFGALNVDVNPLRIAGELGELVDHLLRYEHPIADTHFLAG